MGQFKSAIDTKAIPLLGMASKMKGGHSPDQG